MIDFTFNNPRYMDMLNKQVIFMDQGVCYNPEYLSSRNMHDYPSRMMQIARAVFLGELKPSAYGADIIFNSILSGQGERWQNFGESPNNYLWCQMISRALFAGHSLAPQFPTLPQGDAGKWAQAFAQLDGDTVLLVDQANYAYGADSAKALANFLNRKGIKISGYGPYDTGWQDLATGQVQQGIEKLNRLVADLSGKGRVITVSGEGHYMLTVMAKELGISYDFEVQNILDIADGIKTNNAYVYGGSFYTRYLGMADRIMELTPNKNEQPIPNNWEFQPVYEGDARVNKVNKWEVPLCAEFLNTTEKTELASRIFYMAASRIAEIPHTQIVTLDIHAHKAVDKSLYYWELLS